jgi:heavy metal sensor kinase
MKFYPQKARARLALTYAMTVLVLVGIYSASLFYLYRKDVYKDLTKRLRRDVESMEMLLSEADSQGKLLETLARVDFKNFDPANWMTEVWDHQGNRIFTSGAQTEFRLGKLEDVCFHSSSKDFDKVLDNGLNVRVFCMPSESMPDRYIIRTARLTETVALELQNFSRIMFFGAPLIVFLAGLFGYLFARRVLLPIQKITEKAKAITAERLSERLPIENPGDELGELAMTFNQTFERLESSFEQMKRFTGDASHEFRTPLAAIRTIGEVALRKKNANHVETIEEILEQTERLQNLCESLLMLSRADSGSIAFRFQKISLIQLIQETVDVLQVLAEEKNILIEMNLPNDIWMDADTSFLRQALMNLINNAIQYSPPESKVLVVASEASGEIKISIQDQGPGIAMEHQSRIFDRFYRIDSGRSRVSGGAGLGLSICQWIVSAHQGKIELKSEVGQGSEFILHFKKG